LPKATAAYEETRRHWFWASYSLMKENGEWRIQSISDEGVNAQNLSIEELQKKLDEIDKYLTELTEKHKTANAKQKTGTTTQRRQEELKKYAAETASYIMRFLYYTDVLLKKVPLDRTLYTGAVTGAMMLNQYERGLVYLLPLIQRFPEEHGPLLRQVANAYRQLSRKYFDNDDEERAERFTELAEKALQESLASENSFEAHISLAELLIDENERLDEAREHLLQAQEMASDADEEAHVELHLGEIAAEEDDDQEALAHFQRVIELRPEEDESWSNLGLAHKNLGNIEEAISSYRHAIELAPDDADYYYSLSKVYEDTNQFEKAVKVLADGLLANPDSIPLNIYLSSLYLAKDDYQHAEIYLKKAERIDPESEPVLIMRPLFEIKKAGQMLPTSPPRKFLKQKRERREEG
jgi:tetratricopeptide (TPR) repeat protein